MQTSKVSIVIASYNMGHLISETIQSCLDQSYEDKEIIVYDDCSTDDTLHAIKNFASTGIVHYHKGEKNLGVGNAFNAAIKKATGDIIVLMCADDLFADENVISDIVNVFRTCEHVGHITRSYFQFIDGDKDRKPVRAWRGNDIMMLSSNPSGLAYRKEALKGCVASCRMFIETTALTYQVIHKGWGYHILPYDTIAVRVHESTSAQGGYWLKRRVSSPVMDWYLLGCKSILKDYASLIQIKCNYKMEALWEEIMNFVRLRPQNLLNFSFIFYSALTLLCPRWILRKLPPLYRKYIGAYTTKRIYRP